MVPHRRWQLTISNCVEVIVSNPVALFKKGYLVSISVKPLFPSLELHIICFQRAIQSCLSAILTFKNTHKRDVVAIYRPFQSRHHRSAC